MTPAAYSSARDVILTYEDTIRRMTYLLGSVATLQGARRPAAKPFNISNFDASYPSPPSSMPDENSSNRTTVGTAAKAIPNYILYMRYDNNEFGKTWENLRKQVRGGCVCPTAADFVSYSNLWVEYNKTIALYFNVNSTSYSLFGYFNDAALNQTRNIFTAAKALLDRIESCKTCLLENIKNGNARNFKKYCKGYNLETVSAGVTDASCIAHGIRAIKRISDNFKNGLILRQKRNERSKKGVQVRTYAQISRSYSLILRGNNNFANNITLIRSSKLKVCS